MRRINHFMAFIVSGVKLSNITFTIFYKLYFGYHPQSFRALLSFKAWGQELAIFCLSGLILYVI